MAQGRGFVRGAAFHESRVVLRVGDVRGRGPFRQGAVLHKPHAVLRARARIRTRTIARAGARLQPPADSTDHSALTAPLAETVERAPVVPSASVASQCGPRRASETHSVPGPHVRTPQMRVAGGEHHQARVLHPAVRVFVPPAVVLLQRTPAPGAGADRCPRKAAAARARRGGRRGTGPAGSSTGAAARRGAAARNVVARRCAGRCGAGPRAPGGSGARAGSRGAPGSAARRGSAWCWPRRYARRDRPSRRAGRGGRARPRPGRCTRR